MKSKSRNLVGCFALKTLALIGALAAMPLAAQADATTYTVSGTETYNSGSYSYGEVQIGVSDTSALNIGGAGYTVSGTTFLGYNPSGNGTLSVTSGTYASSSLTVGYNGTGVLNIDGGVVTANAGGGNTGNINIGSENGTSGTGTVTLNSGTLACSDNVMVGSGGTGVLNINGGRFSTNYLIIGSNGRVSVTGGSTEIGAGLQIMASGGSGSLEISNHASMTIATLYLGMTDSTSNNALTVTSGTFISVNTMLYVLAGTNTLTVGNEGTLQVGDGTGTITMGFSGMPSMGGVNTLNLGTGGTSGGVLKASEVSVGSGTGTVNFNFTGTNSYNQTFSGNLGLNNLGTGKTILTGTNSYTGLTKINAGEIDVNGSLATTGTVQVNTGARLGGSGTVGNVNVTGGTVAPGNSPGTLTVTSMTMDATSTLEIQITGTAAGSFDQIKASDFVSLSGTLALTGLDLLSIGDTLMLIEVAGGTKVTGSFSAVTVSGTSVGLVYTGTSSTFTLGSQKYEVNYEGGDGNDVTVTVESVPEPQPWVLIAGGLALLIVIQRQRRMHPRHLK